MELGTLVICVYLVRSHIVMHVALVYGHSVAR